MTQLSVNINKIALIRNSRGNNYPDLIQVAKDCERFGAQGITVHPRPDERHVKFSDCYKLKEIVTTEFNIEGYPSEQFLKLIQDVRPHQVTLVPDLPNALTSDNGWDTITHASFLKEVIEELKKSGARVSLFIDPIEQYIEGAAHAGSDRIEYYTGPYAAIFTGDPNHAISKYKATENFAHSIGLGINAGHDLNLYNLKYFKEQLPHLAEVSIGHALICDSLYFGLENTIQMYRRCLE
ncbi:MAG: pyridoxine 5'-phosphate synthase [Chitinophagales bacterium]|nr:pyridoxine 5'-phosphate synthase [Chitinophagales bacterium]MCZ2392891.1 pyridoxine 5'-phosphate synthase [Chitinophagales bacterium]